MESYRHNLNPEQEKAVLAIVGPVLIIAGAGAGKTKTISHRILHLIKTGIAPSEILAITFTNKAAKEMRDRVMKLLSDDPTLNLPITFTSGYEKPFISTFHGLGVHILKENSQLLKISRHFTIFDKSDSKRAVKEAIILSNLDPKQFEAGKILSIISREKGKFVTLPEYQERATDYFSRIVSMVWEHYEHILQTEKALDFDDLLLKTVLLLFKYPEILKQYQETWKYIHIDEYQDTNHVQYLLGKLLSGSRKNLCVVGDGDQNIYSWRGARMENILNFEKDFPDATVILLEKNYRSTKTILSAANAVISKNTLRKEKNLFTDNVEGEKIVIYKALDELDEAEFITKTAAKLIREGALAEEIAVLYRANYQSRVLEEEFLRQTVPYQVLGVRFFERKEIKDVLSYIKAALDPENLSDLKRVINVPTRGVGKVTLLKILSGQKESLGGGLQLKIQNFYTLLERIRIVSEKEVTSKLVKFVITESGIEDMYRDGKDEDEERLQNVQELVTLATKYDIHEPIEGLEKFLTEAALASDQDELKEDKRGVKLMTIHAAKGLEFDYVFITGLEQGLFPSTRADSDVPTEESEEERRLMYVALTRARHKLFLSYAETRTIYGMSQAQIPSEFFADLPDELVESSESELMNDSRAQSIRKIFTIDF